MLTLALVRTLVLIKYVAKMISRKLHFMGSGKSLFCHGKYISLYQDQSLYLIYIYLVRLHWAINGKGLGRCSRI